MKKIVFILSLTLACHVSMACDFCNSYLGITDSYNQHSVGIRFKHSEQSHKFIQHTMRTQHDIDHGAPSNSGDWHANYNTIELYGKYIISPKVRAMAFLPYAMNTFTYNEDQVTENNLGDLTILVHTQVLNTSNFDSASVRHRMFIGGGVKLPTGKYEMDMTLAIPFSHHLIPGTGSTDVLTSLQYIGSFAKVGWSMDLSYKLNFENPDNYKFGNTFNANVSGFYKVKAGNNLLVPYVRSSLETADYDHMNEMQMTNSGGIIWWNGAGVEFHFASFKLDLNLVLPSVQQLNGEQPENDFRGLASLNYNF